MASEEKLPSNVRIITYNIAGNQARFNYSKILAVLRSVDADVICLQEVSGTDLDHTQAHALARDLRLSCLFGQAHQRRYPFGNAILSRFPLSSATRIDLPRGSLKRDNGNPMPGQKERRLALAATVSPFKERPKFDFIVISVHMGIYNSEDLRGPPALRPGELISRFVNDKQRKHMPALLCGDFNTQRGSTVLGRLDLNWNFYESDSTMRRMKIDFICDRQRGLWKMAERHSVLSDEQTDTASDHRPLIATWAPILEG